MLYGKDNARTPSKSPSKTNKKPVVPKAAGIMSKKKPAAVKRSVPSAAANDLYIQYGQDKDLESIKFNFKTHKRTEADSESDLGVDLDSPESDLSADNLTVKFNFKPAKRKRTEADSESEISVDLDYLEFNFKPPKRKRTESDSETEISVVAAELRFKKAFFWPKTDYLQKKNSQIA